MAPSPIATLDLVVPPRIDLGHRGLPTGDRRPGCQSRGTPGRAINHAAAHGVCGLVQDRARRGGRYRYARALYGVRSNQSAVSMAAATVALEQLVASVDGGVDLTLDAVLRAHHALMHDDPTEAPYAGRLRDVQNWIGGSDHSPRNALYVPPPPETVRGVHVRPTRIHAPCGHVDAGAGGDRHAQFESIHPFTDGNGRIGRALINTVLRRRGVTSTVVVPLASALVARREAYFELLTRYREGDPTPLVSAFATSSRLAAQESRVTAARMAAFPEMWREAVGRSVPTALPPGCSTRFRRCRSFPPRRPRMWSGWRRARCTAGWIAWSRPGPPPADRPQAEPGVGGRLTCSTSSTTSASASARPPTQQHEQAPLGRATDCTTSSSSSSSRSSSGTRFGESNSPSLLKSSRAVEPTSACSMPTSSSLTSCASVGSRGCPATTTCSSR